jgi:hypothetical protein
MHNLLEKNTLSNAMFTQVYFRTNKDESKSWLAMSNRTHNFSFHWHPVADSIPVRAKVSKLEREWWFFVFFVSFLRAAASFDAGGSFSLERAFIFIVFV